MTKKGLFSFILYMLYLFFGGGMTIYNSIAIDKQNQAGGNINSIGLAVLMIFGIILAVYGLAGIILKGIHMISGLGFFAFLCVLLDLAAIYFWIIFLLPSGDLSALGGMTFADFLPSVIPLSLSAVSLISNIRSMRR